MCVRRNIKGEIMINQEIIDEIYLKLNKLAKNIPESPDELQDEDAISPVRNLCLRFLDKYYGDVPRLTQNDQKRLRRSVSEAKSKMKAAEGTKYYKEYYQDWRTLYEELEQQYSAEAMDHVLMLSSSQPIIMNLLTLTNCFNTLAHSPNKELISTSYELKELLLKNLLTLIKPDNALVLPSDNPNIKSVVYFKIGSHSDYQYISFHAHSIPPTAEPEKNKLYQYLERQLQFTQNPTTQALSETSINTILKGYLNNSQNLSELWTKTSTKQLDLDSILLNHQKNEEPSKQVESFEGGGTYEPLKLRPLETILKELLTTPSEKTQKLLPALHSTKKHFGCQVSKIAEIELLKTAFDEKSINEEEFYTYQEKQLSDLIKTCTSPRIEIKSCGKDTEIKKDWNCGKKVFVLKIQNNPNAKPLIWEISNKTATNLIKNNPEKNLKSSGRTIKQIDNMPIFDTLTQNRSAKENIIPDFQAVTHSNKQNNIPNPVITSKSIIPETLQQTCNMANMENFYSYPDSLEKLKEITKSMDKPSQDFVAFILCYFAKEEDKKRFFKSRNEEYENDR